MLYLSLLFYRVLLAAFKSSYSRTYVLVRHQNFRSRNIDRNNNELVQRRVKMAQSPLAACVDSLGASVALLQSSIAILDDGTQDFPRLTTVLQTTRVSFCPPLPSFPLPSPPPLGPSLLINHPDYFFYFSQIDKMGNEIYI